MSADRGDRKSYPKRERVTGKVEGLRCAGGAQPNAGQQSYPARVSDYSGGGSGGGRCGQCGCGCGDGERCGGDEYSGREYDQHGGTGVYTAVGFGSALAPSAQFDVGRAVGPKEFSGNGAEWEDAGNFGDGQNRG